MFLSVLLHRRTIIVVLLVATGSIVGKTSAFELNESLLGVPSPPYLVGDLLTDDQLSNLQCTESDNGLLVCPIRRHDDRMFAVMVDRSESANRVTTAMVF